jgi:DNA-binding response OmpR family regulator
MGASPELGRLPEQGVDVLVVDDDGPVRSTVAQILRDSGYSVETAEDGDAALDLLHRCSASIILLDLQMPHRGGLSMLKALTTLEEATRARTEGRIVTYLQKPVKPTQLLETVASALGRSVAG